MKTSQECETTLTSQYVTPSLSFFPFVFMSFCHFVFFVFFVLFGLFYLEWTSCMKKVILMTLSLSAQQRAKKLYENSDSGDTFTFCPVKSGEAV